MALDIGLQMLGSGVKQMPAVLVWRHRGADSPHEGDHHIRCKTQLGNVSGIERNV